LQTQVVTGPLKAAVVGASGIGRHHAKWLQALGAQVVALVGSSAATAAVTAANLREQFQIEAIPYFSIATMLTEQDPDLVHVCTPPEVHYPQVLQLAPHRCHLLCEKPLTWDDTKSAAALLSEARQMVAETERAGRVTALNLQYTAAPSAYYMLCEQLGLTVEHPRQFFMHMDSRRESNVYEVIWRELGPHTLSVLTAFCGPGAIVPSSMELVLHQRQCRAQFLYQRAGDAACACELVVGTVLEGLLTRRFGINDILADYEGRNDEKGVFRTYLRLGEREVVSDDFMYLSMRQMLLAVTGQASRPLATLAEGLSNQELQLQLLAAGRRA
jgi:Oxidoreductase family, NAD-binding Rossmann fold